MRTKQGCSSSWVPYGFVVLARKYKIERAAPGFLTYVLLNSHDISSSKSQISSSTALSMYCWVRNTMRKTLRLSCVAHVRGAAVLVGSGAQAENKSIHMHVPPVMYVGPNQRWNASRCPAVPPALPLARKFNEIPSGGVVLEC